MLVRRQPDKDDAHHGGTVQVEPNFALCAFYVQDILGSKPLTMITPNKAIATRIGVSQRTVESERARILEAFGSETATEMAIKIGEYRLLNKIRRRRVEARLQWQLVAN